MFYVEKPVGLTTSSKRNPARLMIAGFHFLEGDEIIDLGLFF